MISDRNKMDSDGNINEKRHPAENDNLLFKIFFCWVIPVLMKGRKRDLEVKDFYRPRNEDEAERLGNKLDREWEKELAKKKAGKQPSLTTAAVRTFGWVYVGWGMFSIFAECVTRVIQPVFLGWLVRHYSDIPCTNTTQWLSPWSSEWRCITAVESYLAAGGIVLTAILYLFAYHHYFIGVREMGMKLRIACCSLIYRKVRKHYTSHTSFVLTIPDPQSLRLSKSAMGKTTVGQMVNLLSNDVSKFDESLVMIQYLIIGPLQAVCAGLILWPYMGYSSLFGLSVILLYTPFQMAMGKIFSKFRSKIMALTDERIRLMSETIAGIRVIKMYTWEKLFVDMVADIRKREISKIRVSSYLRGLNISLFIVSSKIILFVSFLSFVLIYPNLVLNAEIVFVSMTLFNNFRVTMILNFSNGIAQGAETLISLRRLQKFLLLEEQEQTCINSSILRPKPEHCGVWLENVTTIWNKENTSPTLENITASVETGELLAIVGPVGSGKSSLLMSILGEIPAIAGTVKLCGKIAYASQEPWVFAGSIRENILFGQEFDENKYRRVVNACALERDIELLPYGDHTLVGERGMSLSGGQKARVNLARAVYTDADVFLMDDPLSAVDTAIAKHLFEQCIDGFLKNKVRILVTHQIQFLKAATKIIVLKEGKIFKLLSKGENLMALIEPGDIARTKISNDTVHSETGTILESTMPLVSNVEEFNKMNKLTSEEKVPKQAEESKSSGSVSADLYWKYMRAGGGFVLIFLLLFSNIMCQALFNESDFWLKQWTDAMTNAVFNTTTEELETTVETWHYIYIYAAMVGGVTILSIACSILFYTMCTRASVNLHNQMFNHIIRAPVAFFDKNPTGRVLNRFTKDMGTIDDLLPSVIHDVIVTFFISVGAIMVVLIINFYITVPSLVVVLFFYKLRQFYVCAARDVKRLEGIARSPIFSHISTSLYGMTTIRAFSVQSMFEKQFYHYQNLHTRSWYMSLSAARWFGVVLEFMCIIYVALVILFLLLIPTEAGETSGGNVGLALSSVLFLSGVFQLGVRQSAEMENQMTSVERVLEYTEVESEAELESTTDRRPPPEWPQKGEVVFQNMCLTYSSTEPPVLKQLNCSIKQNEKVGIVGRTGAGKSSMITALFRMTEPEGIIIIDGVVTKDIGLHDLRSKISIIPQDPVLFNGAIRKNIDPFGKDSDDQIWSVLNDVQLKEVVQNLPNGLDSYITEGGSNFSVGQRQLICMSRAILRNNRILVLDEATANVDNRTDALIQKTIRKKFQNCTVLTIAHRLNTIMDCDRVMVLDAGQIKEFDEPHLLLQNDKGAFTEMVKNTGLAMADQLKVVALETYQSRHGGKIKSRPSIRSLNKQPMSAIPEQIKPGSSPQDSEMSTASVDEIDENVINAAKEDLEIAPKVEEEQEEEKLEERL